MLNQLPSPIIYAHRGASIYAPENTISAFELAVRQGADAIEFDAKLSSDGQVVIFHDQTLERTTGVQGRVGATSFEDLRRLDAGSHFDVAFRGERIPTLDDVFEAVGSQIFMNVELTNYASLFDSLPEKVAETVKRHNLTERVMFSSFSPVALLRARRQLPQVPIGLLCWWGRNGAIPRSPLGYLLRYQSLNPYLEDTNPALVQRIHRRGCKVFVYTVNKAEDLRRMFQIGVDGVFTDDQVLARQILTSTKTRQTENDR